MKGETGVLSPLPRSTALISHLADTQAVYPMAQNAGLTKLHLGVERGVRKPGDRWLACGWRETVDRRMEWSRVKASEQHMENCQFPETGKGACDTAKRS